MLKTILSLFPVFVLLFVFFFLFCVIPASAYNQADQTRNATFMQLGLKSAGQCVGLLIFVFALLKLVQRVSKPETPCDLAAVGMCVLGAALLVEPNWGVAIAFGVLVTAHSIEYCRTGRKSSTAATSTEQASS